MVIALLGVAAPPASPSPAASATPAPAGPVGASRLIDPGIALALFSIVTAALVISAMFVAARDPAKYRKPDDKDVEVLRLRYGFWLVIGALVLTLAVVVVILTAIAPAEPKTTDIVAMITAVTGVFGTLVAAFFGIQAAGAGRSQALSALSDQLRGQGTRDGSAVKIEPSYGPHAGDTRVTVSGDGFTGATAVNFGAVPGSNVEVVNDGLLRVTSPAQDKIDQVVLSLIFPSATVNRRLGTFFYYTVKESHGAAAGQNGITVRGAGLETVNAVQFGTTPGTVTGYDNGVLSITVPPGTAGADVDVALIYPVNAPTRRFVVGKYHYD